MKDKSQDMIRSHSFEEYLKRAEAFHGFAAPGIAVGGFMVELALRHMPPEESYCALCETVKCLPDAVLLLTPCTVGNGKLVVADVGRYALTLYSRESGKGVRVYIDPAKLNPWSEFKSWFFRLKSKKEQDYNLLMKQIEEAGMDVCSVQRVTVAPKYTIKTHRTGFALCPRCNESYPIDDGQYCRACDGETSLYADVTE